MRRVSVFVVINRFSEKTNLGKEIIDALNDYSDIKVFQTKLANRISYAESATQGLGAFEWKDAKAKTEFARLGDEVFAEIEKLQ